VVFVILLLVLSLLLVLLLLQVLVLWVVLLPLCGIAGVVDGVRVGGVGACCRWCC